MLTPIGSMSLKPLALGLLGTIILSAGLAVAARAAGQVLQGGAGGLAALLVGSGSSRDGKPTRNPAGDGHAAPSASPTSEAPGRAGGMARAQHDARPNTSDAAPLGPKAAGSTNHVSQRAPHSTHTPSLDKGSPSASAGLPRVRPQRVLRLRTDAPTCQDVYVYIVSIFENVGDSVATLALDANKRGRQRRVGQWLGRYEIVGIGYNASRVSSAVWLAEGSRVCQALVRDANPVREKQRLRQVARAKQVSAAARKARLKRAKLRGAKRHR